MILIPLFILSRDTKKSTTTTKQEADIFFIISLEHSEYNQEILANKVVLVAR